MGSSLTATSNGRFTGIDIGDNYPRGINFWSYGQSDRFDRIINTIYEFKTSHSHSPISPAGVTYDKYEEISSPESTYYKWSNDNNVYTELSAPGFEENNDAYNVFFVGENPPLDNSLTSEFG